MHPPSKEIREDEIRTSDICVFRKEKGKSLQRLGYHGLTVVSARTLERAKGRDHFWHTFSQQDAALARMLSARATRTSVSTAYYEREMISS